MKRNLIKLSFILSIVTILFSATSCSKDEEDDQMIWDYIPVMLRVYLQNSAGENLLDPDTKGNLLDEEMYINYNDERYIVERGWPQSDWGYKINHATRDLMPTWYGAFIAPSMNENQPNTGESIFIGEFQGILSEATINLHIKNLEYVLSFTSKLKKPGVIERHFYLDGKENKDGATFYITIVD